MSKIIVEIKEKIAYITINSPKTLNALDTSIIKSLNEALLSVQQSDKVRVVLITGAGEKAFVAGANIKEFANYSQEEGKALAQQGHDLLFDLIANFTKPVISAINGYALGGGLELAMACHIRIASQHAKLGQPEVSLGLIPGYGGTQRLTQLVGKGKALEMILTGDVISANEALSIGLINDVVAKEDLLFTCEKMAEKIIKNAPQAIAKSIKAVNAVYDNRGLKEEITLFGECFGTQNFKEGVSAFLEKRTPEF